MNVMEDLCVGCGKCVPFCPRSAIRIEDRKAVIDSDLCVECGVCLKQAKCPKGALCQIHLEAPRAYRKAFSDPFGKHENTALKHAGRGTEEVKTNDVTGVVHRLDKITFAAEMGRPGIGASFRDMQTVLMKIAPYAEMYEVNNPVTPLIVDKEKGLLDPSVLGEEVMSAIIEFSCKLEDADAVLSALREAAQQINTVFSLCIICKVDERDNSLPVDALIEHLNLDIHAASAKTNLGLGRPKYKEHIEGGGR